VADVAEELEKEAAAAAAALPTQPQAPATGAVAAVSEVQHQQQEQQLSATPTARAGAISSSKTLGQQEGGGVPSASTTVQALQSSQAAVPVVVPHASGRLGAGPLASEIAGHLRQALSLASTPPPAAVAQLGRNCHMPNALTSPLQVTNCISSCFCR
jgi:hypothetical protein